MSNPTIYIIKCNSGVYGWYFDKDEAEKACSWEDAEFPKHGYYVDEVEFEDIPSLILSEIHYNIKNKLIDYLPPDWVEWGIENKLINP
jgi:hypothetical protein